MNIGNLIYLILMIWIIGFLGMKNDIPTLFTFVAFLGASSAGIVNFNIFFKIAQTAIAIPLIFNLLTSYFTNIASDPLGCQAKQADSSLSLLQRFPCMEAIGIIFYEEKNNFWESSRYYLFVHVGLFKVLISIFKLLKSSGDYFNPKKEEELLLHVENSFGENKIPIIQLALVQLGA